MLLSVRVADCLSQRGLAASIPSKKTVLMGSFPRIAFRISNMWHKTQRRPRIPRLDPKVLKNPKALAEVFERLLRGNTELAKLQRNIVRLQFSLKLKMNDNAWQTYLLLE